MCPMMSFFISCLAFLLQIVPQLRTTCKRMKNYETTGAFLWIPNCLFHRCKSFHLFLNSSTTFLYKKLSIRTNLLYLLNSCRENAEIQLQSIYTSRDKLFLKFERRFEILKFMSVLNITTEISEFPKKFP